MGIRPSAHPGYRANLGDSQFAVCQEATLDAPHQKPRCGYCPIGLPPPGTSCQSLDFFLQGTAQVVVANPDPTSVIELYRFLKLAALRKVLTQVLVRDQGDVKATLMEEEFSSIEEVLAAIGDDGTGTREAAEQSLQEFNPLFVLNRVIPNSKLTIAYLQQMVGKFIGGDLVMLGEIPADESVEQSMRIF